MRWLLVSFLFAFLIMVLLFRDVADPLVVGRVAHIEHYGTSQRHCDITLQNGSVVFCPYSKCLDAQNGLCMYSDLSFRVCPPGVP